MAMQPNIPTDDSARPACTPGVSALAALDVPPLLDPDAQVSGEIRRAVQAIERWLEEYAILSDNHRAADEKARSGEAGDKAYFEMLDALLSDYGDTFDKVTARLLEAPATSAQELIAKATAYARAWALHWRPRRDWRGMSAEAAIDHLDSARDNTSLSCLVIEMLADLDRLAAKERAQ